MNLFLQWSLLCLSVEGGGYSLLTQLCLSNAYQTKQHFIKKLKILNFGIRK